jgi:hypothetical protein
VVDDDHQLDLAGHARPHLVRPGENLVQQLDRVEVNAVGNVAGARIEAQVEARDRAEEARAGAAGGPEEVRVVDLVGPHQLAVGGDHVDRLDAHAGGAVDAAVPAEAALQQVAAEGDAGAVPGREEEVALSQRDQQLVAAHARPDHCRPRLGIDLDRVQPGDVEQHAAVAQVVAGPAVAAGADSDPQALGAGLPDRGYQVRLALRLNDQVGEAGGRASVPDGGTPRLLVPVLPTPESTPHRTMVLQV